MEQELGFIYSLGKIKAIEALKLILSKLEKDSAVAIFYDEEVKFDNIENVVMHHSGAAFNFGFGDYKFRFGTVANGAHCYLYINKIKKTNFLEWQEWVNLFYNETPFLMAYILDEEYSTWQNAADKLIYNASNKSYKGLPLKSNGLPYPVEQEIIDISGNPCRRIIKLGYVEVIGAQMWLGDGFWKVSPLSKSEVIDNLENSGIKFQNNDLLYIEADAQPFVEASSKELQHSLRKAIFNT